MKILSLFLAVYISFLAGEPALANIHLDKKEQASCEKKCCHRTDSSTEKQEQKNDTHKKNCCDGGACNPFMICGCCFAQIASTGSSENIYFSATVATGAPSEQNLFSNFFSNCFHPPEA